MTEDPKQGASDSFDKPRRPYEKPRLLYREPLEAVAANCAEPGKGGPASACMFGSS